MLQLNPKIKKALIEIDFVRRYEKLSNSFNDEKTPMNERLRYIDGEIIFDIIEKLGYSVSFNSKEKFFYTKDEQLGDYIWWSALIINNIINILLISLFLLNWYNK